MQKRPVSLLLSTAAVLLSTALFSYAQTAGGAVGATASDGFGKAFESAGGSAAAQKVRGSMGSVIGRAAARKRSAASRPSTSGRTGTAKPSSAVPEARRHSIDTGRTFFRPDPSKNVANSLADMLGQTADEKKLLREIFSATRTAFEEEVAAKGKQNNIASAFTFFIASSSMVYHDDPEPSEEDLDDLWEGLESVFEEMPEVAAMSNSDKQEIYETLVAFSGMLLVGYVTAKEAGDRATLNIYRELAGKLIQTVLQTSPDKVRFGPDGFMTGQ